MQTNTAYHSQNSYEVQEKSEAKFKDEERSISVCCALTTTTARMNHIIHYIKALASVSRGICLSWEQPQWVKYSEKKNLHTAPEWISMKQCSKSLPCPSSPYCWCFSREGVPLQELSHGCSSQTTQSAQHLQAATVQNWSSKFQCAFWGKKINPKENWADYRWKDYTTYIWIPVPYKGRSN